MKSILALTLLALSASTHAFSSLSGLAGIYGRNPGPNFDFNSEAFHKAKRALNLPSVLNITGIKQIPDKDHPFIAPGPNDKRGPCPGMNLLANHGYIPRNGVITLEQSVHGCQEAFNLAWDVGVIFSFLGMWSGGNIETQQYSIGGPSDLVPPIVGKDGTVFYKPLGMANSHGLFEGDVSLTRLDKAIKNDSFTFNQPLYDDFVRHANRYGDGKFTDKVISEYRWTRWVQSNKTGKFDFTPIEVFVNGGASNLFYVCYRNASEANNRWVSKENMAYFVGAGEHKHEQFPPNWYRSNDCPLELIVGDAHRLYQQRPVGFKEGILAASYGRATTLHDFACHTLGYLVSVISPKGTSEFDQRLGAQLADWGPFLGGIFATKFGCT